MQSYRIYYAEREVKGQDAATLLEKVYGGSAGGGIDPSAIKETEWEETYDARNAGEALRSFFRDHAGEGGRILIAEEDGGARDVEPGESFDPDRTYIWVEESSLMEYQGLDESTPGMVACPLCDGTGEVEEAVADEYEAARE
jgi:hypothetical protein